MPTNLRTRIVTATLLLITLVALRPVCAQDGMRTERVQFARGATNAIVEDSITGYDIVNYTIGAGQGQSIFISLQTDNASTYFNLLEPGETDVATYNGSIEGNQYSGILQASGDYVVRVYLMRNAARRNETANYRLEVQISDASDATRAGLGDFDATRRIPCAQFAGQPSVPCDFGVARSGNGNATVIVTRPDGTRRAIFFVDGKANSADTSQADGYPEFSVTRERDLSLVRVGDERYEIPDAVPFGG